MKALIIIGLQVDLLPLGAAEIAGSDAIIPAVNGLLDEFEIVIAAQFSYPAKHKMFVANYPWRRPGQEIDLLGDKILLKNYYCIEGTFGAEPAMGFNSEKVTYTARMGTDKRLLSFSAFYDENKKRDTGLNAHLTENQITEIYLVGLPLETTVANTAIDAIEAGFEVIIFKDAICGIEKTLTEDIFNDLKRKGVQIKSSLAGNF